MNNQKKMFRTDLALDEFEYLKNIQNEKTYNKKNYNGFDVYYLNIDEDLSNKINKKRDYIIHLI